MEFQKQELSIIHSEAMTLNHKDILCLLLRNMEPSLLIRINLKEKLFIFIHSIKSKNMMKSIKLKLLVLCTIWISKLKIIFLMLSLCNCKDMEVQATNVWELLLMMLIVMFNLIREFTFGIFVPLRLLLEQWGEYVSWYRQKIKTIGII